MRLAMAMGLLALAACGGAPAAFDCDSPGQACTWAGVAGKVGFNGDGHHRLETELYWTMDLRFTRDGTPWFIDWNNHLLRKVLPDQSVKTVVGWTDPIFPGDGAPDERSTDGALGTEVQLNHPTDLAELPDGTLALMAWHNHKLRKVDPQTGRVTIVCGAGVGFAGDNGPATAALFKQPKSLVLDEQQNTYILDQGNLRVRKIDATGIIRTIVGSGVKGFAGDGGPAVKAALNFDTGSNPEPSGGLALHGNTLYIADTNNHRIRSVDLSSGLITTLAGTGEAGYAGDGASALAAQFNHPRDLEVGPDGELYIADTDNGRVRAINLSSGLVRTVAGTGELGLTGAEGLAATETPLWRPFGVAFDKAGNLYISDTLNSRIVRVAR